MKVADYYDSATDFKYLHSATLQGKSNEKVAKLRNSNLLAHHIKNYLNNNPPPPSNRKCRDKLMLKTVLVACFQIQAIFLSDVETFPGISEKPFSRQPTWAHWAKVIKSFSRLKRRPTTTFF
jgi:hypothetical protein